MDVLKVWKVQNGKGTYVYKDNRDNIRITNYLINNISKLNNTISCFAPDVKTESYQSNFDIKIKPHDAGIFPADPVFLLVILDVDWIPKDVLTLILNVNPHKYIFCTASIEKDLNRFHLKVAPVIRAEELASKELKVGVSQRLIYNISVDLNTDDQKLYDDYTSRMDDIFAMFDGDFNTINYCYRGNSIKGITADVYRREFAARNHWHERLDTSIEYYAEIDRHYNPNVIFEEAKLYFTLLKDRNHLIDEHSEKSYAAYKIISYHDSKRFVVVCKNNTMANNVRNFINKNSKRKSQAIHNDLSTVHFKGNDGEFIVYKSGKKKGLPRDFGSGTQIDTYVEWFNRKLINIIIITNAVKKDILLKEVDSIIYLSPRCILYDDLQKRIAIKFNSNINITNVYLSGTKDERVLLDNQKGSKYTPRYYFKGDMRKLIFD